MSKLIWGDTLRDLALDVKIPKKTGSGNLAAIKKMVIADSSLALQLSCTPTVKDVDIFLIDIKLVNGGWKIGFGMDARGRKLDFSEDFHFVVPFVDPDLQNGMELKCTFELEYYRDGELVESGELTNYSLHKDNVLLNKKFKRTPLIGVDKPDPSIKFNHIHYQDWGRGAGCTVYIDYSQLPGKPNAIFTHLGQDDIGHTTFNISANSQNDVSGVAFLPYPNPNRRIEGDASKFEWTFQQVGNDKDDAVFHKESLSNGTLEDDPFTISLVDIAPSEQ